jgi:hypothetical protein
MGSATMVVGGGRVLLMNRVYSFIVGANNEGVVMDRVTKSRLDRLCGYLNTITGIEHTIEYAYGRPRLMRSGGSVEVSPRLPKPALYDWIHAYLDGWTACSNRK